MIDSVSTYAMWTPFCNDGNMPTQYLASTASDQITTFYQQLYMDFASTKSLTKDVYTYKVEGVMCVCT